ncbi:hypothetical protein BN406_00986 [Sinorhizobium meliloti Rm41]|jgi:hypothetical protein|nr:hypothetical protein BN406_00986 [Sinorhizobium meliloti Rm41]
MRTLGKVCVTAVSACGCAGIFHLRLGLRIVSPYRRTASVPTSTLIPVLVTGIQQRRVCGAEQFFKPKDLGLLDSCDGHRNEVGGRYALRAVSACGCAGIFHLRLGLRIVSPYRRTASVPTSTLIPVPVTGIQQRRVCGGGRVFQPKDLVWLDFCDGHRNEVGRRYALRQCPLAGVRAYFNCGAACG